MTLRLAATAAAVAKKSRVPTCPEDRPLLSKREAAQFLGNISTRTLDRLVASGELSPVRVTPGTLRYRRVDLQSFVDSREYSRGRFPGA